MRDAMKHEILGLLGRVFARVHNLRSDAEISEALWLIHQVAAREEAEFQAENQAASRESDATRH